MELFSKSKLNRGLQGAAAAPSESNTYIQTCSDLSGFLVFRSKSSKMEHRFNNHVTEK